MYQTRDKWRHTKGRKRIYVADEAHARVKEMCEEYNVSMSDMMNRLIFIAEKNRFLVAPRDLNLRYGAVLNMRAQNQIKKSISDQTGTD